MSHTQREQPLRRHQSKMFRSRLPQQKLRVLHHRKSLRHLQRRPQPVIRSRRHADPPTGSPRAPRNGLILEHVIKRRVQFFHRHLPRHTQRPRRRGSSPSTSAAPAQDLSPPFTIATMRSSTVAKSTPDTRAISPNGFRWNPCSFVFRHRQDARIDVRLPISVGTIIKLIRNYPLTHPPNIPRPLNS